MLLCYIVGGIFCAIIILHSILEVHYFLRMFLAVFLAKCFKRKVHILHETSVMGLCITTDIDTLLFHMNNARYIRELDFARVDFYERTNLYKTIRSKGGTLVQGACTIRYRRFVRPFSFYKITSKIVYWDEKTIFMEHRFITPTDNFIRAIAICRQRLINCSAEDVIETLLKVEFPTAKGGGDVEAVPKSKPKIPKEIALWIESNEISSQNLRNGC